MKRYVAFDFGAESGRAIVGSLDDGRLTLEELHRFPTQGIVVLGTRQWDVTRIYGEMLVALKVYVARYGSRLDGIGVDSWGVDFGLIARDGTVLANPVHYRDKSHDGAMEAAIAKIGREELYRRTGIQFLPFNTAFQLYAMVQQKSPLLAAADSLLMMGDLFAYMLSGRRACEYTNASTSQLLDAQRRTWDDNLISSLGIPRHLLLDPVQPGTVLGPMLPEVAKATGLSTDARIIAPATHDTGAAVAAVPVHKNAGDWAYLSSGTWSLLGAEINEPMITDESCRLNFTNEGGVGGKIRFLKNIIGLWIVQECRRSWERDGEKLDYPKLMAEAAAAEPFRTIIDVDDRTLLAPEDMPAVITSIAQKSGQPVPQARGQFVRCALESLALKYRNTLREMDKLLGRQTQRLHVIGGGSQNQLLCQMTADACGIEVYAGPSEATAAGNIITQALGTGAIASLADARQIIISSFAPVVYEPANTHTWESLAL